MSKITNLQVYAPNPKDITSLYRAVGPLSELRKKYPHLNITIHEKLEWHQLKMSDIVFLQRPWLDTHLQIAEIAKDIGSALWVDWDDDLTSIPKSNVHKVHYNSPKLPENIKQIAALADIISVTTTSLKNNVLKDFESKVRIIPNALEDKYYIGLDAIDYNERKAIVAWRGGQSHNIDLMDVRDQLIALSKAHTAWSFAFLGYEPTMQMHGMREGSWGSIPNQDFGAYMQSLKTMSPPIMMVPLANDIFNQSKSMIAWLEASVAGSLVVAPEYVPDFVRPGVLTYKNNKEFGDIMHTIMKNPSVVESANKQALQYIGDVLLLSKVNEQRKQLITDLQELL